MPDQFYVWKRSALKKKPHKDVAEQLLKRIADQVCYDNSQVILNLKRN